jgi:biopolymer transport protein ExbD
MNDPVFGALGSEMAEITGRKPSENTAEFDITSMVDLVFMMTIYFLMTSIGAVMAQADLAAAKHVTSADEERAVIFSLVIRGDPHAPILFIGNADEGEAITDPDVQAERVTAAVEEGPIGDDGNITVIVKADKKVRFGDVMRIGRAIGVIENAKMNLAVLEVD